MIGSSNKMQAAFMEQLAQLSRKPFSATPLLHDLYIWCTKTVAKDQLLFNLVFGQSIQPIHKQMCTGIDRTQSNGKIPEHSFNSLPATVLFVRLFNSLEVRRFMHNIWSGGVECEYQHQHTNNNTNMCEYGNEINSFFAR